MVVDYLANYKFFIPEVTDLIYDEWSDLFLAGGTSKEQLEHLFEERAVIDKLPLTIVVIDEGILVGTGSIKLYELGTKKGVSPWLAGIYVKKSHRGLGVGTMIVRFLEAKALSLGVSKMYLSVGRAMEFYERLGWNVVERVNSYGVKDVVIMNKSLIK